MNGRGTTPLRYQWKKNGSNLANGAKVSGATIKKLTLMGVAWGDAASYTVVITNVVGSVTSSPAVLTVISPPEVATQPVSRTNNEGTVATFSVVVSGTVPFDYRWKKNGLNLTNSGNVSGATSAVLSVASVAPSDTGSYTVVITNAAGSVSSLPAALIVIAGAPTITGQPISRTTFPGSTVTFPVVSWGTEPLNYQWRKNGSDLANVGNVSGATTPILILSDVLKADEGSYLVLITNQVGSAVSDIAVLNVDTSLRFVNCFVNGSGLFQTRLVGPAGSNFIIQACTEWSPWTSIATNYAPNGIFDFTDPMNFPDPNLPDTVSTNRYYRARLAP